VLCSTLGVGKIVKDQISPVAEIQRYVGAGLKATDSNPSQLLGLDGEALPRSTGY
jgi:hypothetical protein